MKTHPTIGTVLFVALLLIAAAAMSGCASLEDAGHSSYSASAVKDAAGRVVGYDFSVRDGKEFAGRQIQFQAQGDAVAVTITEGESKAFKGQAMSAKALSLFPVTGLQDLLK
jgi:hypothetical protein